MKRKTQRAFRGPRPRVTKARTINSKVESSVFKLWSATRNTRPGVYRQCQGSSPNSAISVDTTEPQFLPE